VTVTEKERMYVELARELICLRDGYLSLSNGFVMTRARGPSDNYFKLCHS